MNEHRPGVWTIFTKIKSNPERADSRKLINPPKFGLLDVKLLLENLPLSRNFIFLELGNIFSTRNDENALYFLICPLFRWIISTNITHFHKLLNSTLPQMTLPERVTRSAITLPGLFHDNCMSRPVAWLLNILFSPTHVAQQCSPYVTGQTCMKCSCDCYRADLRGEIFHSFFLTQYGRHCRPVLVWWISWH